MSARPAPPAAPAPPQIPDSTMVTPRVETAPQPGVGYRASPPVPRVGTIATPKEKGVKRFSAARIFALIGLLASTGAILGCLLPWLVEVKGPDAEMLDVPWDNHPKYIFVCIIGFALIAFLVGLLSSNRWTFVMAFLASGFCLAILLWVLKQAWYEKVFDRARYGLWITFGCLALMFLFSIVSFVALTWRKI